jgi:hypothetical protein
MDRAAAMPLLTSAVVRGCQRATSEFKNTGVRLRLGRVVDARILLLAFPHGMTAPRRLFANDLLA